MPPSEAVPSLEKEKLQHRKHHHHHTTAPRWSWSESQASFFNCTGEITPAPRKDRYVTWQSTSALGNALNVFAHAFIYALVSGRQLMVGRGVVPELFCSPQDGAYLCGIPFANKTFLKSTPHRTASWLHLDDPTRIHQVSERWYAYKSLGSAINRDIPNNQPSPISKALIGTCVKQALRCPPKNPRNGLDDESCIMVRAMQLLLPGTLLRKEFADRALVTASDRWLGDLSDLEIVLGHSTTHTQISQLEEESSRVFFDPPTSRNDASRRFAGAIHIRAVPPKFENDNSQKDNDIFLKFMHQMNATLPDTSGTSPADSLWLCATKNALRADLILAPRRREYWPQSIFIATDSSGLCHIARDRLQRYNPNQDADTLSLDKELQSVAAATTTTTTFESTQYPLDRNPPTFTKERHKRTMQVNANSIACMDVNPIHISRVERSTAIKNTTGLDPHQLAILDWHLLVRSRWLLSVGRAGDHCAKGSRPQGNHDVGNPGRSFFGWALSASGLAHPPQPVPMRNCVCKVDKNSVSVWFPHAVQQDIQPENVILSSHHSSFQSALPASSLAGLPLVTSLYSGLPSSGLTRLKRRLFSMIQRR